MVKHLLLITLLCLSVTACDLGPDSPRGFSLPKGNVDAGKAVFLKYGCIDCHTIEGVKVPDNHTYHIPKAVPLGGSSGSITTYGELVTSIINPSHKLTRRQPVSFTSEDGTSLMRDVNDELTVSELIDLVAYLQPKYKVVPYRTSEYRLYQLRMPDKNEGN
ncbi:c-type cytochrome [Alteromonas sp. 345S023]|uniref:C-type cytochrome n=1 Tax=Alteromonas profundi TaxID=2696062 RepID=A0A7X5LLQ0_9ALTE|nr:c-type cytochrome [Alteromonas profundi]NDV91249.1 c-type cytochrome [Alteromonas profundi]